MKQRSTHKNKGIHFGLAGIGWLRSARWCCIFLLGLTPLLAGQALAITSVQEIEQAVEQHLNSRLRALKSAHREGQRTSHQISPIDPRLRLADCQSPLEIKLSSRRLIGRLTAKVACAGPAPWAIYVPVTIQVFKKVVTMRTPGAPGDLLHEDDLTLSEREVGQLTQGYFTHIHEAANQALKRQAPMGSVLTPKMVEQPKVIKRGDEVMIVANKGSLSVSSPGVALSDGRIGQQISIKNRASKRTVKARVMDKGLVAVTM